MPTAHGGAQPDPGLCGGRPLTAEQLWQPSSRREAHTTIWEVFSHNPGQRQWPQSLRRHFLQTLRHIFLLGEWKGLRHSYQVRTLPFFCLCCCLLSSRIFFAIMSKQMIGLLQHSVSKESPGRAVHSHSLLATFIEPLTAAFWQNNHISVIQTANVNHKIILVLIMYYFSFKMHKLVFLR